MSHLLDTSITLFILLWLSTACTQPAQEQSQLAHLIVATGTPTSTYTARPTRTWTATPTYQEEKARALATALVHATYAPFPTKSPTATLTPLPIATATLTPLPIATATLTPLPVATAVTSDEHFPGSEPHDPFNTEHFPVWEYPERGMPEHDRENK